jgi:YHS domain-containing protein
MRTLTKLAITAAVGLPLLTLSAAAAFSSTKRVAPVSWGWFGEVHTVDGVALGGYDALSYHDGAPARGSAAHATTWHGATWQFTSAAHAEQFAANPERYAPAFGGFCSFAVSRGFTASTDPTAWHIDEDGQLYVFDSDAMKADWMDDLAANRTLSEENWHTR